MPSPGRKTKDEVLTVLSDGHWHGIREIDDRVGRVGFRTIRAALQTLVADGEIVERPVVVRKEYTRRLPMHPDYLPAFNPNDPDIQTCIDMMRGRDESDGDILDTLVMELDLSETDAYAALDANAK
jgi:hypothetical protein